MLGSARKLAVSAIRKAQSRYKKYYDRQARKSTLQLGDWVLVKFPQEETGRLRKLSRPWYGPYHIRSLESPNATVTKVYFPEDGPLHIHQSRVQPCPPSFPSGFYWYGSKRYSPGKMPQWIQTLSLDPDEQHQSSRYSLRSSPSSVRSSQ